MKELFPELKKDNKPTVVWFCDVADDKTNRNIDGKIFKNEPMGIALKRFNCLRVNVLELPEGDLKNEYVKLAPAFLFFDPAAEPVSKPLSGKRATSLGAFSSLVEKTWSKTFTMKFKAYKDGYTKILGLMDKADLQKTKIEKDKARLAEKPNPAKQRKLQQEEEDLKEQMAEIDKQEKELIEACALRAEFLPPEEVGEK